MKVTEYDLEKAIPSLEGKVVFITGGKYTLYGTRRKALISAQAPLDSARKPLRSSPSTG